MKKIILCFAIFLFYAYANAQTARQLDSLKMLLPDFDGKQKINLLNKIAFEHTYTSKNWKLIDSLAGEALMLSEKDKYEKGIADAYLNLSFSVYNNQNDIKKSTEYLKKALEIYTKINDKNGMAWCNQQIGYNDFFMGELADMKHWYQNAYKLFYDLNDTRQILGFLQTSTFTYYAGYTKLSGLIQHLSEIKNDYSAKNNELGEAYFNSTIAKAYLTYRMYDSTLYFNNLALKLTAQKENSRERAFAFLIQSEYFTAKSQFDSAIISLNSVLKSAVAVGDTFLLVRCYTFYARNYLLSGQVEKSDSMYSMAAELSSLRYNKLELHIVLEEASYFNQKQGRYGFALKYNFELLASLEETQTMDEFPDLYRQISQIYITLKEYDKALEYQRKAIASLPKLDYRYIEASAYTSLGRVFYLRSEYDSAVIYLDKAENILKKEKMERFLLVNQYYYALCYLKMKNYDKAKELLDQCLDLKKTLGIKIFVISTSVAVNSTIAQMYIELKKYDLALKYVTYSLEEHETDLMRDMHIFRDDYYSLYVIYKQKGNVAKALEYHEKYLELKEKLEQDDNLRKISSLEIKSATEKKEKENELLKKDNLLKQTEMKRQSLVRNIFIIGFLMMIALAVVILRSYNQKKKDNLLLTKQKQEISEKNEELNQLNEEISAQRDSLQDLNDELQAKNDEIEFQRDEIQKKNLNITSSITYASRIQKAILPRVEILSVIFPESFIFFKPRDIVSGDFYFIKKVNDYLLVAAADCTGHGVPGAFMSMLGIALLNEIVRKQEINTAGMVLDELRNYVKIALHQSQEKSEAKDGMDIAFCAINLNTLELQFAGANNPLWIIKKGILHTINPDRQPIGIFPKEHPFTNNDIQLEKGDTVYLFSDGYESQFGGEKGDKLKMKRFQEIIVNASDKSINEQHEFLEMKFNQWKGSHEQVDDILVIGLKV